MASRTASRMSASTSYTSHPQQTTESRTYTARQSNARSRRTRPRTAISTLAGHENQQVICAVSESRGISPTVGLAFVNLDTCEAVLCQISDSQTYIKTLHKLNVYSPSEILFMSTMVTPQSKLFSVIEEDLEGLGISITPVDRRYFAEDSGMNYIHQLALTDDVETIKLAVTGNYFAVCSLSAVSRLLSMYDTNSPCHRL